MFDTKKIHRTLEKIQKDIENHELDNYGLPWWDDKRVEDVDALVKDLIELRDVHGFTSQGMNEWLVLLEYAQAAYHKGINREKAETELKKRDPKEIKRLNYFLKKLVNDIKIFETEGTGMLILENHNFPIEKYPEAAQFMAHHPGDLKKMNQAAGDNTDGLYWFGLPVVVGAGLVTEKYWPEIVKGLIEMAQAAGDNTDSLYWYGLPKVVEAGLVTEKYWPGLIKMAQAAGDNTDSLYWFGLPMVVEAGLVTEENWDKLVKLVKILSKNLDKKNIQNLFHKTLSQFILFHKVVDVNTIGDFTVAVVNKYGKGHQQISKIFKELVPLVESNEDLELLWSYLKISSVISFNLFKEYKNLDEKNRKAFLEDHKKRYSDIVLGKDTKFTVKNFPYILHAINSPSLSDQKLKQTLETYGKKASELPPTTFTSFNLKSIKDVGGLKVKGKLDEKLFTYYREFIQLINNSKPIEINYNELLAEKVKYSESILGTEFSFEIAWRVKMLEVFSNLGEAMKNKLIKITNEDFKSFSNDLFELRDVYNAFLELYNDTIKDNVADLGEYEEKFLKTIHRPLSRIDQLEKELKKFQEIEGREDVNITCIPSKTPLDLFYGYYGENCTSKAPEELLEPAFTPVRMIHTDEIVGCLHFYEVVYQGKRILAILGIEPRSPLVNAVNNEDLFDTIIDSCKKQAKKNGFDYVCLPVNPTMHSNRGQIGKLIAEIIRNKEHLDIDFNFPKNLDYKTQGLRII